MITASVMKELSAYSHASVSWHYYKSGCYDKYSYVQVLSAATVIAKHTAGLCNACKAASTKTDNPVAKRHFVQSAKDVANNTANLVKSIKVNPFISVSLFFQMRIFPGCIDKHFEKLFCFSINGGNVENSPVSINLFKVNSINVWKMCAIYSKLTINTLERRFWRLSGVFIIKFEHISRLFLVFLLLLWTSKYSLGRGPCLT